MTGIATLIECSTANRAQRNQAERLLEAIISNQKCSDVFRTSHTPHHVGVVHNRLNRPNNSQILKVIDRLELLAKLNYLNYRQKMIPLATNQGLQTIPMIVITHINPKYLAHALKQESSSQARLNDAIDPRTWKRLPEIIKDNWKHLNADMRAYVLQGFDRQKSAWSPLFSYQQPIKPVSISVTLPTNSFETYDLASLLIGFERDPNDKFKRIDPDTGDSFSLDALRPARALKSSHPKMAAKM